MHSDGPETKLEQVFDNYQFKLVDWNAAILVSKKARMREDNAQNRMLSSVAQAQTSNAYNAYQEARMELNDAILTAWKQKPNWERHIIKVIQN